MQNLSSANFRQLSYEEGGQMVTRYWVTENSFSAPKKIITVDDAFSANDYIRLASQGTSFVWKGDFHNAKQLLQAVQRRISKKSSPSSLGTDPKSLSQEFYKHRQHQAYKAQLLSRLMILIESDLSIPLRRAPDLSQAIREAVNPPSDKFLISLRELSGFVGAHEWRKKGVVIQALEGKKIYAHYGVFSPVRGDYLDLVALAPLPNDIKTVFDIGTGTGVISAILAHRGVSQIIATDMDPRALACARENLNQLGFGPQVRVVQADLFPEGTADLIVCNPPWLPAKPTSAIEYAVYDEDSKMLKSFLSKVTAHLNQDGEAWLIISDLAEHLGLRGADELQKLFQQSGLEIIDRLETKPQHSKATDVEDRLFEARSREKVYLWRLSPRKS